MGACYNKDSLSELDWSEGDFGSSDMRLVSSSDMRLASLSSIVDTMLRLSQRSQDSMSSYSREVEDELGVDELCELLRAEWMKNVFLRERNNLPCESINRFADIFHRWTNPADLSIGMQWVKDLLREENERLANHRPFLSNSISLFGYWDCNENLTCLFVGSLNVVLPISEKSIVKLFDTEKAICALDVYYKQNNDDKKAMFVPLVGYVRNTVNPAWLTGFHITSFKPRVGCIGAVGMGVPWHQNEGPTLDHDVNFCRRWFAEVCGLKRASAVRIERDGKVFVIGIYGQQPWIDSISISEDQIILGKLTE